MVLLLVDVGKAETQLQLVVVVVVVVVFLVVVVDVVDAKTLLRWLLWGIKQFKMVITLDNAINRNRNGTAPGAMARRMNTPSCIHVLKLVVL